VPTEARYELPYAEMQTTSRVGYMTAFFLALTAIFLHFGRDDVRAADAASTAVTELKDWIEGPLPLFARDSLAGERTDLGQLRSGAVLVHFFATWCESCRAELTALQQFQARLHDRSVTIIGVDVGEVDSRVRRFFAMEPASFPILLDRDSTASKTWRVSVLPTTFLLDGDLVPRLVAEGDVDWASPEIEKSVTTLTRPKLPGTASAF
jgi:thiol-disulfide isomerase/thioredoxin